MKKQINSATKAHLIRSAFYLLLLLAICAIPFALAQRNADKRKQSTQFQKAPETQAVASSSGVFAPDLSSWTLAANYPLNVESVAVATDGRYLYSAGGLAGDPINAVYRYDPVANTWTPLANLPVALAEARAAYAANTNKVYVFGGVGPSSISNQTYVYDIASNTWERRRFYARRPEMG